jgi:hypothetical protein
LGVGHESASSIAVTEAATWQTANDSDAATGAPGDGQLTQATAQADPPAAQRTEMRRQP